MIINDGTNIFNKFEASLTDDTRVIIYNHHMFIVQAIAQGKYKEITSGLLQVTVHSILNYRIRKRTWLKGIEHLNFSGLYYKHTMIVNKHCQQAWSFTY